MSLAVALAPRFATRAILDASEGRRTDVHESAELRETIIGCFHALEVGDAEFFERHVLRGGELRLIGGASEEWFGGIEGFDLMREQAATGRAELRAAPELVEAYTSGDVGWGAAVIRYSNGAGQTAMARETFVFHRFETTWKLVQSHTSFPVSDEDAFRSTEPGPH